MMSSDPARNVQTRIGSAQEVQQCLAPSKPAGCLVTLSMLHASEKSEAVAAELRHHRATAITTLEARLARGIADGDVPAGVDIAAMARFYVTVQQGMSIQSRDGASRDTILGIARTAMAAWEPLTAVHG